MLHLGFYTDDLLSDAVTDSCYVRFRKMYIQYNEAGHLVQCSLNSDVSLYTNSTLHRQNMYRCIICNVNLYNI